MHSPPAWLQALVSERRRQFAARQHETAPDCILDTGALPAGTTPAPSPAPARAASGVFQGVPVGTGSACGPARMLHAPDQGQRLMPGDIVVAASTDPSWTPLFLRAAGLVMETGGFLSCGAIVAREFGIPAAVNRRGILARLTDGDRLQVDGAKGTVSRLPHRAVEQIPV
ncbi:MAG: hypothetical protein JNJ60_11965 [Rhodocyclaceae bacterium]|nr:hypothetical protein [Rhodocyclaceae bacterium]